MPTDYQSLYVLASGMLLQERKLSVVANNVANANTPGFKRDLLLAESFFAPRGEPAQATSPLLPQNNFVFPIVRDVLSVLSQGALVKTGNPLDLAIDGEGFFAVLTPRGEILFTRKGTFRISDEGLLVTEEGYPVLDENLSPIALWDTPRVTKEGDIFVGDEIVARIGVFSLTEPRKVGNDFFSGAFERASDYKVLQGFYEASNTEPVKEMVRLVEALRAHEIFTKLVQMSDELQGKINNMA
ncbi:MAG: flagellar hook-basal body protein [Aquificae bacterium]|nr:flagellar hook-basal body protein [Aquificota bacterium]